MRFLMRVSLPVDAGNEQIRSGKVQESLQSMMQDLKPEAAYFYLEQGQRTALFVVNMQDASQLPGMVEPFFLGFEADVEIFPVMLPEDLAKADLAGLAKKYPGV